MHLLVQQGVDWKSYFTTKRAYPHPHPTTVPSFARLLPPAFPLSYIYWQPTRKRRRNNKEKKRTIFSALPISPPQHDHQPTAWKTIFYDFCSDNFEAPFQSGQFSKTSSVGGESSDEGEEKEGGGLAELVTPSTTEMDEGHSQIWHLGVAGGVFKYYYYVTIVSMYESFWI